jgi:hypothetical protein
LRFQNSRDPKEISTIDRERGRRTVDLVERSNSQVEAESSIEKDRCPWIIDSRRLMYGGKQGLRVETPEAQITK